MRSTTLDLIFLTSLAAGLVYFSVDAWLGMSGGVHIAPLNREIDRLEGDVRRLEAQRDQLRQKNASLRGPVVDPELLEERLRAVHGVADPRDALIIND